MTVTAETAAECPETWLGRRLAAGIPAETWKPVPRIDGCAFSGYEAADTGRARSVDRIGRNGRPLQGKEVSTRVRKDGYVLLDMRCDNPAHKRPHTQTMHKVVLTTFDKPCPPGMETRHLHGRPESNWYPENLIWGTRAENAWDKPAEVRSGASRKAAVTRAPATASSRARTYLVETLADGPRLVADLQDEAAAMGISREVLHATRRDLALTWMLSLPVTAMEARGLPLQSVVEACWQSPSSEQPITVRDGTVTGCAGIGQPILAPAARCSARDCGACEDGTIWLGYLGRSAPCPVCRLRSVTERGVAAQRDQQQGVAGR